MEHAFLALHVVMSWVSAPEMPYETQKFNQYFWRIFRICEIGMSSLPRAVSLSYEKRSPLLSLSHRYLDAKSIFIP